MIRYGFNIRTRHGQPVDNILIMAATQSDAERRLRQMYDRCQIVECLTQAVPRAKVDTRDLASVIELISASEPPHVPAMRSVPARPPEGHWPPRGAASAASFGGSPLPPRAR